MLVVQSVNVHWLYSRNQLAYAFIRKKPLKRYKNMLNHWFSLKIESINEM